MSRPTNKTHLFARWSKKEQAVLYGYPNKSDGGWLAWQFEGEPNNFVRELVKRGYDPTTLRFSVERIKGPENG